MSQKSTDKKAIQKLLYAAVRYLHDPSKQIVTVPVQHVQNLNLLKPTINGMYNVLRNNKLVPAQLFQLGGTVEEALAPGNKRRKFKNIRVSAAGLQIDAEKKKEAQLLAKKKKHQKQLGKDKDRQLQESIMKKRNENIGKDQASVGKVTHNGKAVKQKRMNKATDDKILEKRFNTLKSNKLDFSGAEAALDDLDKIETMPAESYETETNKEITTYRATIVKLQQEIASLEVSNSLLVQEFNEKMKTMQDRLDSLLSDNYILKEKLLMADSLASNILPVNETITPAKESPSSELRLRTTLSHDQKTTTADAPTTKAASENGSSSIIFISSSDSENSYKPSAHVKFPIDLDGDKHKDDVHLKKEVVTPSSHSLNDEHNESDESSQSSTRNEEFGDEIFDDEATTNSKIKSPLDLQGNSIDFNVPLNNAPRVSSARRSLKFSTSSSVLGSNERHRVEKSIQPISIHSTIQPRPKTNAKADITNDPIENELVTPKSTPKSAALHRKNDVVSTTPFKVTSSNLPSLGPDTTNQQILTPKTIYPISPVVLIREEKSNHGIKRAMTSQSDDSNSSDHSIKRRKMEALSVSKNLSDEESMNDSESDSSISSDSSSNSMHGKKNGSEMDYNSDSYEKFEIAEDFSVFDYVDEDGNKTRLFHLKFGLCIPYESWKILKHNISPSIFVRKLSLLIWKSTNILRKRALKPEKTKKTDDKPRKPLTPRKKAILQKSYTYYLKINYTRKEAQRRKEFWTRYLSIYLNSLNAGTKSKVESNDGKKKKKGSKIMSTGIKLEKPKKKKKTSGKK